MHFLWFHIKDVIKSFETFERYLKYMMLRFNRSLAVVNCCQFENLFINVNKSGIRRKSEKGVVIDKFYPTNYFQTVTFLVIYIFGGSK